MTLPSRSSDRRPADPTGWATLLGLGLLTLGWFAPAPAARPQAPPQVTGSAVNLVPPAFGTSDGNRDLIAVTGPDQTGGSVLWIIDSASKQLAVYQAMGGSGSQAGVKFIGARRIDLDLQVLGYNDRSKQSYEDLQRAFDRLEEPDEGDAIPPGSR